MAPTATSEFTRLLQAAQQGRENALDRVFAMVYDELRVVAGNQMARVPASDTFQPTALVHEVYLRLVGKTELQLQNRRHFFAVAARAMHDIVVEQARKHQALKRGGNRARLSLDENTVEARDQCEQVLALSEAIARLKAEDELAAEVVMFRFFGGLTHEETAVVLDLPVIRIRREWSYAKSYLRGELEQ